MTKVVIIGAGLAGCAAGYYLSRAGCEVVIYEAGEGIAGGASGNDVGMVNPRFSAFESPESLFYVTAFEQAVSLFEELGDDVAWNPCGALHLITDEKREKRYRQTAQNWSLDDLKLVNAAEASEIAGVDVPFEAMFLERSGSVSPRKLCDRLAEGLDIRFGEYVEDLGALDADVVVVANAMGGVELLDLPLKGVRGQITEVRGNEVSKDLKVNLHYGGYLSAARDGVHTIGATFQRWLDHTDIVDEDDVYNIEKLSGFLPDLAEGMGVVGHRASIRTTAVDHFPVIGHVRDHIYVSTAHGSHGVVTSIGGAQMLVDMIMGRGVGYSDETVTALCPKRFKDAKNLV